MSICCPFKSISPPNNNKLFPYGVSGRIRTESFIHTHDGCFNNEYGTESFIHGVDWRVYFTFGSQASLRWAKPPVESLLDVCGSVFKYNTDHEQSEAKFLITK
jgi:hypothetical protein